MQFTRDSFPFLRDGVGDLRVSLAWVFFHCPRSASYALFPVHWFFTETASRQRVHTLYPIRHSFAQHVCLPVQKPTINSAATTETIANSLYAPRPAPPLLCAAVQHEWL